MSLIKLENVKKTYFMESMNLEVLKGIDLQIGKGEFISIMGPSGSGKSTLMNILGCLDKPTSGKYMLDEIDVGSLDTDELAQIRNKKIGFVFQGFNLLSRTTALENVELPMVYASVSPELRDTRAKKALEIVGLTDRMSHMPNELSGGQQQRVAIARAIVNQAPIIFADEPTGNLDTKTGVEVMNLFTNLNKTLGVTIILVTHEEEIAQYSDRIIRLIDGVIVSDEKVLK